jgi:hypothetical protein
MVLLNLDDSEFSILCGIQESDPFIESEAVQQFMIISHYLN